jgi:hypothetical protein
MSSLASTPGKALVIPRIEINGSGREGEVELVGMYLLWSKIIIYLVIAIPRTR